MGERWGWAAALVVGLSACGGSGHSASGITTPDAGTTNPPPDAGTPDAGTPDAGVTLKPPPVKDRWTFYGTEQGLSPDVRDVSADEGGNVYVAGVDALYAKGKADPAFARFDGDSGGLTKNCYDVGVPQDDASAVFKERLLQASHPNPPGPAILCPVLSVAGMQPGHAAVGFRGLGTDGDYDADWATDSGGVDLVSFDAASKTTQRDRHVFFATPPHFICGVTGAETFGATSCPDVTDPIWAGGRRKLRQVFRIAVNHEKSSPMYGDLWAGGTHATFAALVNPATALQRGWHDITIGQTDPKWKNSQFTWEHDHPGILGSHSQFLTGYAFALSIDPRTGRPWGSNGYRTGWMAGYGADVSSRTWWIAPAPPDPAKPWYDFWTDDPADPEGPTADMVQSMSHCPDGSLWIGSQTHGLVHLDPGGGVAGYEGLPNPALHGNGVNAVACDASDGSIWIGVFWGGLMRRAPDGHITFLDTTGMPAFTNGVPNSIQIDRWSTPRVVYVAYGPHKDPATGQTVAGGVAAYDGP